MVMFSCNRCSKGLKKKDVLNHSFQCGGRNNINVTCIDCLKDFRGNEYDKHTSCVTEEVRYGGKGTIAKETGKKQNQWLGIVRQVLKVNNSLEVPVKKFLQSIQHMENIPRNQKKFHNWANSAMHIKDRTFLDKVFNVLQEEFQKSNEANKNKENAAKKQDDNSEEIQTEENGVNGNKKGSDDVQELDDAEDEKVKKKKKKKRDSEKMDDSVENGEDNAEEVDTNENGLNGDVEEECADVEDEKVKKKKKKKRDSEKMDESVENGEDSAEEDVEDEKPKKKKTRDSNLVEESGEPMEEGNPETTEAKEDNVKLTKKQKKLKKKKEKFEAELQEIENAKKEEGESEIVEEEVSKTKKNKKRKLVEENDDVKPAQDDAGKDSKRQKVENRVNENGNDESTEPTAVSPSKKQKFDWFQTIVDVLKKSKNDEVSVKKMTKKVISEYISRYGDLGIHEKLEAKMAKKLRTCPSIKVLKDKVKLIETEN